MRHNLYKILGFFFVLTAGITSCTEDDSVNFTEPAAALRIDTPTATNIILNFGLPENPALTVTWTDGLSSASSYDVQLAAAETFENPIAVGTSTTSSFSMSTTELNAILNTLNVNSLNSVPVFIRVSGNGNLSNVVGFTVTAYPTEGVEITSPAANDSFVLALDNADDTAMTITWEDLSNSTTNHEIQMAVSGTDFVAPVSAGSIENTNSFELTHSNLNGVVLGLGLESESAGNVDLRIVSSSMNSSGAINVRVSETVTVSVTPYSVSFPNLYLVGDATTPGWNNNNNNTAVFRDQNFLNRYVHTGFFSAGAFKLLETLGQWEPQWGTNGGTTITVDRLGTANPGTFNVATAGYYTYTFTTVGDGGTFSVTPYDASSALTYSSIAIIGDATPNGWDGDNDTNLNQDPNNPHLWFLNGVNLTNGGQMLIRANDMWSDVWRYTGSDNDFFGNSILAGGGDNIPFNGPTGSYDVWFNDLDGSYVFIPNN